MLILSTELNETLDGGHIEDITKVVTPTALSKCKSNILLKGIEVHAQYKCYKGRVRAFVKIKKIQQKSENESSYPR